MIDFNKLKNYDKPLEIVKKDNKYLIGRFLYEYDPKRKEMVLSKEYISVTLTKEQYNEYLDKCIETFNELWSK